MPIKPLTDFQKKILLDLLRTDESMVQLSKKYNCSHRLISVQVENICKKYNVESYGMDGARRIETIKHLRGAIKNDSNR